MIAKLTNFLKNLGNSSIILLAAGSGMIAGLGISAGLTKETAAIYAAILAAMIGSYVYRWQKSIDRETAIMSELRQLYARYIEAAKEAFLSQPYIGQEYTIEESKEFFSIGKKERQVLVLRDQIYLLAPDEVIVALHAHDKAFRNWKIEFPEGDNLSDEQKSKMKVLDSELRSRFDELLDAMRENTQLQILPPLSGPAKDALRSN